MLDDINFGNPSQKYIPFLEKACAYDKHIPDLIKFDSDSSNSPSYPSGHTLQAHLIKYVVGNLKPDKYEYLERFATDVEYSRLYLGLNYQSDNDFALFCVETITKDKEFKQKYGL